jgi:hypothetical protein
MLLLVVYAKQKAVKKPVSVLLLKNPLVYRIPPALYAVPVGIVGNGSAMIPKRKQFPHLTI